MALLGGRVNLRRRWDGRVERYCVHGVGHTVAAGTPADFVHGCDGCCAGHVEPPANQAPGGGVS